MAKFTFAVSREMAREMHLHAEILWSEVMRHAFHLKLREVHASHAAFEHTRPPARSSRRSRKAPR